MFDVGFQEIMLIFVILLIVVGPERLPKLARTLGLWIGKARTIVSSVKSEVEREIRVSELKQSLQEQTPTEEFKKLANQVRSINSDLQSTGQNIKSSVESSVKETVNSKTNSPTLPSIDSSINDAENALSNSSLDSQPSKPSSDLTNKSLPNEKISTEKL